MAMTAWSEKVLSKAICLSVKGRTSIRHQNAFVLIETPSRINGVARTVRTPHFNPCPVLASGNSASRRCDVVNMDRLSIKHRAITHPSAHERPLVPYTFRRDRPKLRNNADVTAVYTPDKHVFCAANTRGILSDGVQHRLDISRRAGNDAQYFTRGGLLLQ